MSKPRVTIAFQEQATSAKINELVLDDLAHAQLWLHSISYAEFGGLAESFYLGYIQYNPQKQTFNRMRILGSEYLFGPATTFNLEYTLDSGGTWTDVAPGTDTGVDVSQFFPATPQIGQVNLFYTDVDLTGIGATQYIGLRIDRPAAGAAQEASWNVQSFLFNSAYDPF